MKRAPLAVLGLSISIGFFLLACGEPITPERGQSTVRRLGKADGSDSCQGSCGGQASSGCWCDDQCAAFGDCCHDKAPVCDGQPGSCQGACGGKSADGCWCDDQCESFGDCCADKTNVCQAPPPPPPPGCQNDSECQAGQFCKRPTGSCDLAIGPAQPPAGQCTDKPQACYEIYAPVCGCDGKTYENDCKADAAGANVKQSGKCDPTGQFCGGIAAIPCPAGYTCELDGSYPDAGGKCVEKACHVGGCSGQVCSDQPGVITTCEWLPWYACFQGQACGSYGPNGSCGWQQTPEFVACMIENGGMKPDEKLCLQVNQQYLQALAGARQCSPLIFIEQCQVQVSSQLRCGGCPTWVNNSSELQQIENKWKALKCDTIMWLCPMVLCEAPGSGLCDVQTGACVSSQN